TRYRGAELIAPEGVLLFVLLPPLFGVQRAVAEELEHGAVQFVSARLGGRVDLAGVAAELGGVNAALDLELLQCIDRRPEDEQVPVRIRIFDAVQRVVNEGVSLACDGESLLGPLSALTPGSRERRPLLGRDVRA